jgi:hypothetical protein
MVATGYKNQVALILFSLEIIIPIFGIKFLALSYLSSPSLDDHALAASPIPASPFLPSAPRHDCIVFPFQSQPNRPCRSCPLAVPNLTNPSLTKTAVFILSIPCPPVWPIHDTPALPYLAMPCLTSSRLACVAVPIRTSPSRSTPWRSRPRLDCVAIPSPSLISPYRSPACLHYRAIPNLTRPHHTAPRLLIRGFPNHVVPTLPCLQNPAIPALGTPPAPYHACVTIPIRSVPYQTRSLPRLRCRASPVTYLSAPLRATPAFPDPATPRPDTPCPDTPALPVLTKPGHPIPHPAMTATPFHAILLPHHPGLACVTETHRSEPRCALPCHTCGA